MKMDLNTVAIGEVGVDPTKHAQNSQRFCQLTKTKRVATSRRSHDNARNLDLGWERVRKTNIRESGNYGKREKNLSCSDSGETKRLISRGDDEK